MVPCALLCCLWAKINSGWNWERDNQQANLMKAFTLPSRYFGLSSPRCWGFSWSRSPGRQPWLCLWKKKTKLRSALVFCLWAKHEKRALFHFLWSFSSPSCTPRQTGEQWFIDAVEQWLGEWMNILWAPVAVNKSWGAADKWVAHSTLDNGCWALVKWNLSSQVEFWHLQSVLSAVGKLAWHFCGSWFLNSVYAEES